MSNFKSQAKRKRELAKLDKRQAKDQKRALRKSERAGTVVVASTIAPVPAPSLPSKTAGVPGALPTRAPLTLAEAAERWRTSTIVKPKKR
jgi:hypothetical protein